MKTTAVIITVCCLLASAASVARAQTTEELQQQIDALKQRVEALEQQLKSNPPPQARRQPAAATQNGSGREEALALYSKIDGLVATGNIQQANRELTAYNERYAGTNAAAWTRSLTRELEVVGKTAPEAWSIEKWFQGEDAITLDGRQPTLLVFWEAWCPHCRNEMPKVQQLYDTYRDQGLQVVGVTRITKTATEEMVQSFIDDNGLTYPIAKETGDLAGYFNVKGIPAAAFVENGKIVWRGHPIRLTDELMGIWF